MDPSRDELAAPLRIGYSFLNMTCPQCGTEHPQGSKYCSECGARLPPSAAAAEKAELRQVTVFFSDVSGYTAMSEKLDPEEVKGLMTRIFRKIVAIVQRHEGVVDKFIGDCVMCVFDLPAAREDDALRALEAAIEIRDAVDKINGPELERKIGRRLSLHTGVNTGIAVADQLDLERGTEKLTGDTVNVASRLAGVARPGEIVVGQDTWYQAKLNFDFESLEPVLVKGKEEPLKVYRLCGAKKESQSVKNLSGLRSDLVGREAELRLLAEAAREAGGGASVALSIVGAAGTGKSRLVAEFRKTIDPALPWIEAAARPHASNSSYALWSTLFARLFAIDESDSVHAIREKLEEGAERLAEGRTESLRDCVPFLGNLFSLASPETQKGDPDYIKLNLQRSIKRIVAAIAASRGAILFFDDLHWADSSSLETLRALLEDPPAGILFMCAFRPEFPGCLAGIASERLERKELVLAEVPEDKIEAMLASILKADRLPAALPAFVKERSQGNPFFVEEIVNSLIEQSVLAREEGAWAIRRPLDSVHIPSTIQGLITARIDLLARDLKRLLQEASVIGSSFFYVLLEKITLIRQGLEESLRSLETTDLIRKRAIAPELEYAFKHSLTKDVAYNSLLQSERRSLHRDVARCIEELFPERLAEFYETLAFHFRQAGEIDRAVHYLRRSAEKSLKRFAVEEAHRFYQDAYALLADMPGRTRTEDETLFELLGEWYMTYFLRGDFIEPWEILIRHERLAESLGECPATSVCHLALAGLCWQKAMFAASTRYAEGLLDRARRTGDRDLECDGSLYLSMDCTFSLELERAYSCAEAAFSLIREIKHPKDIVDWHPFILFAKALVLWQMGRTTELLALADELTRYGELNNSSRSLFYAHFYRCCAYSVAGDHEKAGEYCDKAIREARDPWLAQFPKLQLLASYTLLGRVEDAKALLGEVLPVLERSGCEVMAFNCRLSHGMLRVLGGDIVGGLESIRREAEGARSKGQTLFHVASLYYIAKVYQAVALRTASYKPLALLKNLGFLVANVPFAYRRAVRLYSDILDRIPDDRSYLVPLIHLDLGVLHARRRDKAHARAWLSKAAAAFKERGNYKYLEEAEAALARL